MGTGSEDEKIGQEITSDEQLEAWVQGRSIHRYVRWIDMPNHPRGGQHMSECTPDFSCCTPALLAPPEVRQAFAVAVAIGDASVGKMLGGFLSKMLKARMPEKTIRVVGSPPDRSWWERHSVQTGEPS